MFVLPTTGNKKHRPQPYDHVRYDGLNAMRSNQSYSLTLTPSSNSLTHFTPPHLSHPSLSFSALIYESTTSHDCFHIIIYRWCSPSPIPTTAFAISLEEICFKRLSKYVLDTFYLLRFPTLGVEFLHEKNINRM